MAVLLGLKSREEGKAWETQARGRVDGEEAQGESADADRACSWTPPPRLARGMFSPLARLPLSPQQSGPSLSIEARGSVELSTSPLASQLTCAPPSPEFLKKACVSRIASFRVYGTFRTRTANPYEASWRGGV